MEPLKDCTRVALVTGGGRGIGRAIARALAADGRSVVIGDVLQAEAAETVELIQQAGGKALAVTLDVTDSDSVARATSLARERFGPVQILVNNAGWDELMPFVTTDEQFWKKVVDINYLGNLRVTHAVVPMMVEQGHGRIVNIGSDAARIGSSQEAVYSGAKAAVVAFTKTIAREVAQSGITANAVCPGPTRTTALEATLAEHPHADKLVKSITRGIPMGRLGEPEDIAAAVAFLASDQASYITGQTLSVSGGLTMI